MFQSVLWLMLLVGLGFVFGLEIGSVRTTLPDYEMAVGLCVVNDGVDLICANAGCVLHNRQHFTRHWCVKQGVDKQRLTAIYN